MKRDETFVHVAIRNYLKSNGWSLLAGQYPGGSDDELHVFNVFDPLLARDESPDHRRHSFGKLVPDLIAHKGKALLVIEAKPEYSPSDKDKLNYLLSERKADLVNGLEKFIKERGFTHMLPLSEISIIPVLAFLSEYKSPKDNYGYLKVTDLNTVTQENISI
jgi:hypothetical protein